MIRETLEIGTDSIKIILNRLGDIVGGVGSCYRCDSCGVFLTRNEFVYKKMSTVFICHECSFSEVKKIQKDEVEHTKSIHALKCTGVYWDQPK
jgi:hypothetical protein